MAALNEGITESKVRKCPTITCVVCSKKKNLSKYKRHLETHTSNKELSEDSVKQISFQSRYTRKDTKVLNMAPRMGFTCYYSSNSKQCNSIVIDLKRHLVKTHKMDPFSEEYEVLMQKSAGDAPLERKVCLKRSFDHPNNHGEMKNVQERTADSNTIPIPMTRLSTVESVGNSFDFESDESNINTFMTDVSKINRPIFSSESKRDCYFPEKQAVPNYYHQPLTSLLLETSMGANSLTFIDTDKAVNHFESFLLTKGGGGRRMKPIKGDISSFRCLIKAIGWNQFWDPNALNKYVTDATKEGNSSASTIYGRLRVYERFIGFLRTQLPTFLPPTNIISAIDIMIRNLKESLGKDRHSRNKITMAASRERMPTSFKTVREWREKRKNVQIKCLFHEILSEISLLSEKTFVKLRNFLIVEIILANAQRSGIIEGMMIKEVLNAKSDINSESNHFIYVQNHKTDYKQPAIIFLDEEIYSFLYQFVTTILPSLPLIGVQRNASDDHVFQTWRSKDLPSTSVSSCLRAGLLLFGINDPEACPTQYRKAASTLMSMHNPSMQEPLSQFMCHERSTAERHYRHHMSHRFLSSVFTELGRCQTISDGPVTDPEASSPLLSGQHVEPSDKASSEYDSASL